MGAFIASYFYNNPPVQTSPRVKLEAISEEEYDKALDSVAIDIEEWNINVQPQVTLYAHQIQPNGSYATEAPKF